MKKGSVEEGLVYHAGFPNAGEDQQGTSLSLDKLIVKHRASTYFWRLDMAVTELHWPAGTLVVVDRTLPATPGRIVVAIVEEEFTLCRIQRDGFYRLDGTKTDDTGQLWGVVSYAVQEVA
ncbi:MAG: S24 family peptidase [Candidatus Saccharimonadales bacterium]|jgi:DNA polymerase V